jgi:hypothetical protein
MECNHQVATSNKASMRWESGHEFPTKLQINEGIQIDSFARVVGKECAAATIITATFPTDISADYKLQSDSLFMDMLSSAEKVLSETRAGLDTSKIAHVRLFYVSTAKSANGGYVVHNDGVQLRSSLRNAIGFQFANSLPAISVVSVKAISTIDVSKSTREDSRGILFAMQVLLLDPVRLETEIWINEDR